MSLLYSDISLLVTVQLIEDKGPHTSSFFQFLISTRMIFFFIQKVLIGYLLYEDIAMNNIVIF